MEVLEVGTEPRTSKGYRQTSLRNYGNNTIFCVSQGLFFRNTYFKNDPSFNSDRCFSRRELLTLVSSIPFYSQGTVKCPSFVAIGKKFGLVIDGKLAQLLQLYLAQAKFSECYPSQRIFIPCKDYARGIETNFSLLCKGICFSNISQTSPLHQLLLSDQKAEERCVYFYQKGSCFRECSRDNWHLNNKEYCIEDETFGSNKICPALYSFLHQTGLRIPLMIGRKLYFGDWFAEFEEFYHTKGDSALEDGQDNPIDD